MKMKPVKFSLWMIAMSISLLSLNAQPAAGERGKRIDDRLQLSEQQQEQMNDLRKQHQDNMQSIRAQLNIKEAELDAALLKEDANQAKALVKHINQLRGEVFGQLIDHQLAVKGILNEDQKRIFNEMIARKEHEGGARYGDRQGPHKGPHPQPEGGQRGGRGN